MQKKTIYEFIKMLCTLCYRSDLFFSTSSSSSSSRMVIVVCVVAKFHLFSVRSFAITVILLGNFGFAFVFIFTFLFTPGVA